MFYLKTKKHNKGCKLLILHSSVQIIETSVWPTATGTQFNARAVTLGQSKQTNSSYYQC